MAHLSKKKKEQLTKVDRTKQYTFDEAIKAIKEAASAKFDETLEIHCRLNVDPRHADQQVRSTMVLPHGTGKTKRVLVLTTGDTTEAKEAGADEIGGLDAIERIKGGWLDFDAVIASPDMMRHIGPLGKVLGPRGLMPSAKAGTVTANIGEAVKAIKGGRIEFRVDKYGITHNGIGKLSFTEDKLVENAKAYYDAIVKVRPAAVKGAYIKSITLTSTMGCGYKINTTEPLAESK